MKNIGKKVKLHYGTKRSIIGTIDREKKNGKLVIETKYGLKVHAHISQVQFI